MISGVATLPATRDHEDVTDGLVEEDLDGHAGVRAREHGGEGLLLLGRLLGQQGEVLLKRGQPARREPCVPVHQGLQGLVGGQRRLRVSRVWVRSPGMCRRPGRRSRPRPSGAGHVG